MINGKVDANFIITKKLVKEAVVRKCSSKQVFLKVLQCSRENNYVVGLKDYNFIKNKLQHGYFFPVNIAIFLRKLIFTDHLWWLLL